ncbi:MAG: hypothetical protein ABSG33_09825 [Candidatus Bathyarchaeia archaeon]|jgi:hypothetical protein
MDNKIKVLALISIVVAAAVGTAMVLASQTTAKGETPTVASDVQPQLSSINATNSNGFQNGFMGFAGPRGMGGGHGGHDGFGGFQGFGVNFFNGTANGFGPIQVSAAFTQNVTNILNSSTDVQALFNQGWNVTSIRPIITTTIDGNGNVVTQATSANVILQGTDGRALVVVNLTTDKVTKIVTTTINNNPT